MSPLMQGNGVVCWSGVLGRHAGTSLARSLSTFGASTTLPLGQATGDVVAISRNPSIYSAWLEDAFHPVLYVRLV